MNILVAPQEFKGSISALSAAEAAKIGILRAFPQAEVVLGPITSISYRTKHYLGLRKCP
jgi:glycerate kinase